MSSFSCAEQLATLDLGRIGSKCGGTLEDRAQRLFSTKGLQLDEIDPCLTAKDQAENKDSEKHKKTPLLEAQIYKLVKILSEQRVFRRFTRGLYYEFLD